MKHKTGSRDTHARMLLALSAGCLALGSRTWAAEPAPSSSGPAAASNQTRTSIHQEIHLPASPQRLYQLFLSSQQFTIFTGPPATIDAKVGGAFSLFGGRIVGLNVELVPNERIVQAWRPADWPLGLYSLVRIQLVPEGAQTLLVLDHTGFPAGGFDHLSAGWIEHYWEPLNAFLAAPVRNAK